MSIADSLVEAFAPYLTSDLEDYLRSVGVCFEQVERVVGDMEESEESYPTLLDVDLTPPETLRYLAQYLGERIPAGISDPAAREWLQDHPHTRRGTERAIFLAAQRTLTGTRLVSLRTRTRLDGGADIDYIAVRTIASQTPNPDAVYADLRKNLVPADIVLEYQAITGQTWQDVRELGGASVYTWGDVDADFSSWSPVFTTLSGDSFFTRPVPT
jgi:hypothetical protein